MNESILQLEEKIARCRRIASGITDDEVRTALEQLASEYEAQLPKRPARDPDSFMLGRASPDL